MTMRARHTVPLAAALTLLMAGCSGIKDATGLSKEAPDEFQVTTNQPLSVPPEANLRPPKTGADTEAQSEPREEAEAAVFTGAEEEGVQYEGSGGMSRSERALLGTAGAGDASDAVREDIARMAKKDRELANALIFGEDQVGEQLDAQAESERLRENAVEGEPVTEGESRSISIERGDRGWLEGIF